MSSADPEVVDAEATPLLLRRGKEKEGARRPQPGYGADGEAGAVGRAAADPDEHVLLPSHSDHHPFLDATRIICVWIVVVDHGDSTWGEYNMLFGQDWVLQYLYLVCGVCYGMSRRTLYSYEIRLGQYVAIGILLNWSAWVVAGLDWKGNFFSVVFHFWFVVGLMMYALILSPLKPYLERVRDRSEQDEQPEAAGTESTEGGSRSRLGWHEDPHRDGFLRGLLLIGGGLLGILIIFTVVMMPIISATAPVFLKLCQPFGGGQFWGLPSDLPSAHMFLEHMSTNIMLTASNIYLLMVCPMVFKRSSWTPWCLIVYTYSHRLLFYRGPDERPFHGLDLMTIALAVYYLGLTYRRTLGRYLVRYWFVVLFVCGLLWPPGTQQRFDEEPPLDMTTRIRFNLLEAIFVVSWFLAGDLMIQKEIFTEDRLGFLNLWALILFLVHKAVHIVFSEPWNWLVLVGIAPLCYMATRKEEQLSS